MYFFVVAFFPPSPLQEGDSRTPNPRRGHTLKLLPIYVAKVSAKELEQSGVGVAKVPFIEVEAAFAVRQNWKTESYKLSPDIQAQSHVRIGKLRFAAASRAGEEGAPPNQPRASGSSASQRTPSMLCDCHVLDTGAHCCPCFSTHPGARPLTGSKSLHFQISEVKQNWQSRGLLYW